MTPLSTGALQVATLGCNAFSGIEPQALGLTYWFDAAPGGEPYRAEVRFTGHRVGVRDKPSSRDSFAVSETIERVVPGSGRLAITTRVFDIPPGEWSVTASLVTPRHAGAARGDSRRQTGPPKASASGITAFGPVIGARAPGAHLGAWPALVGIGVGVALTAQSMLAARAHLAVARTLLVSLIASAVGLLGARIYYLAEKEPPALLRPRALLTAGMCIQGFVLATITTAIIGAYAVHLPVGPWLDVTAPSLFFGMTIGRLGCFFGGCCAGRPTASRWGLWSSDRRLGVRRVPIQLVESALSLVVGLVALLVVLRGAAKPVGAVFVGAIATYTLGRQVLFPMRDLPRNTSRGRMLTIIVAALIVLADVAVVVLNRNWP